MSGIFGVDCINVLTLWSLVFLAFDLPTMIFIYFDPEKVETLVSS
jgi:hypothetical protein